MASCINNPLPLTSSTLLGEDEGSDVDGGRRVASPGLHGSAEEASVDDSSQDDDKTKLSHHFSVTNSNPSLHLVPFHRSPFSTPTIGCMRWPSIDDVVTALRRNHFRLANNRRPLIDSFQHTAIGQLVALTNRHYRFQVLEKLTRVSKGDGFQNDDMSTVDRKIDTTGEVLTTDVLLSRSNELRQKLFDNTHDAQTWQRRRRLVSASGMPMTSSMDSYRRHGLASQKATSMSSLLNVDTDADVMPPMMTSARSTNKTREVKYPAMMTSIDSDGNPEVTSPMLGSPKLSDVSTNASDHTQRHLTRSHQENEPATGRSNKTRERKSLTVTTSIDSAGNPEVTSPMLDSPKLSDVCTITSDHAPQYLAGSHQENEAATEARELRADCVPAESGSLCQASTDESEEPSWGTCPSSPKRTDDVINDLKSQLIAMSETIKDKDKTISSMRSERGKDVNRLIGNREHLISKLRQQVRASNQENAELRTARLEQTNSIHDLRVTNNDLVTSHMHLTGTVDMLEDLIGELKGELASKDEEQQELNLRMFHKGQACALFERQVMLDMVSKENPDSVLMAELVDKLQDTESRLARWQQMCTAESYESAARDVTEPEVRLTFIKDAMFHYLTDASNAQLHLRIIIEVLGYREKKLEQIFDAIYKPGYMWKPVLNCPCWAPR